MAHLCSAVDEDLTGKKEAQVIESTSSKYTDVQVKGGIRFPAEQPVRLDLQMWTSSQQSACSGLGTEDQTIQSLEPVWSDSGRPGKGIWKQEKKKS